MNSYHEIERFQRKAGQAGFPFRDTGVPAHQRRETGWNLIDQVASVAGPSLKARSHHDGAVSARQPEPDQTPTPQDPEQVQDVALERFASLLKARQQRKSTVVESGESASLKQLLRNIAVGAPADEHWPTQC
ncbi:MAG: hypothetical protein FH757_09050 [Alcanivorax sp.]|nr:hypothetical protein [Alcanivorax sp.]